MSDFSIETLRAFTYGRLDNELLERRMLLHLKEFPQGEVAAYLKQIEQWASRVLDPHDLLYVNLLAEIPTVITTEASSTENVGRDLMVIPSSELPTISSISLAEWTVKLPAKVWGFVGERPRQATAAAACAMLIAIGGYGLGERWHQDDIAAKIAAVQGRQLPVAGEQTNVSVFVVCDPLNPLFVRLDRSGERPTNWECVPTTATPTAGQTVEPFDGIRIQWPVGRPGCVIESDTHLRGILYVHQAKSENADGGLAVISLPLSKQNSLFQTHVTIQPDLLDAPFSAEQAQTARAAWSSYYKVAEQLSNSIEQDFVLIPPGAFNMGSPVSLPDSQPDETEHRVWITKPYFAGRFEVTQGEFEAVMGYNPSHNRETPDGNPSRLPVENLMWFEMVEFCNRLSQLEDWIPFYEIDVSERVDGRAKSASVRVLGGGGYRLPTEAEWEYMCRAGTETRFYVGDSEGGLLSEHAYVLFGNEPVTTHPVGSLKPNPFGLYDMHGNIFEWVYDWYDDSYYRKSPRRDPMGSTIGFSRVIRGGSFKDPPRNGRSANRGRSKCDFPDIDRGFRIVRSIHEGV